MWMIGTQGFSGCMTIETPVAKNSTSSVTLRLVTIFGCNGPSTAEKFTPAFSNIPPLAKTRDLPPPPSARVHLSSLKEATPSVAAIPAQILSCKP